MNPFNPLLYLPLQVFFSLSIQNNLRYISNNLNPNNNSVFNGLLGKQIRFSKINWILKRNSQADFQAWFWAAPVGYWHLDHFKLVENSDIFVWAVESPNSDVQNSSYGPNKICFAGCSENLNFHQIKAQIS